MTTLYENMLINQQNDPENNLTARNSHTEKRIENSIVKIANNLATDLLIKKNCFVKELFSK